MGAQAAKAIGLGLSFAHAVSTLALQGTCVCFFMWSPSLTSLQTRLQPLRACPCEGPVAPPIPALG